ncbi:MAG: hypothetical protein CVV23_14175 [Ignavibacteriae bacterium HGW-Ignavibacteriae-2]|jgi:hypothetical protein|nr:MAG: hypothetical protein CVV23_14175 [Ignavibacteriae bacterium HGW-Ignavibacteriae-2]
MKNLIKITVFATFLLSVVALSASNFLDDETPIAIVKKVIRQVQLRETQESDWTAVKEGEQLMQGGEVRTGTKALALVLLTDGSGLLRVRENSILRIYGERENQKVNKNAFIQEGKVGFEVNKQEDEQFKFTTPTMVASIRGTQGVIDSDDNKVLCEEGIIELAALLGAKEAGVLTAGNTAQITEEGKLVIYTMTDAEKQLLKQTKQIAPKKMIIETDEGILEIEYYSEDEE